MIFDRYGNYVFQKIFKVANQEQRDSCFKKLQPDLMDILQSKEGTHSIQSLIDNLHQEEIIKKFSTFTEDQLIELSTNKFSMHFIQKLLQLMPSNYWLSVIIKNFKKLSVDKQGIVVLKSFINDNQANFEARYEILGACQNCVHEIAFTEFGHYIVE
jgi:glutamine synthetase adenylyltransferase